MLVFTCARFAAAGFEHARAVLVGIFRRAALRFRFFEWRLRSKAGRFPKPTTPTRPEDFRTSMILAARRHVPRPYDGPVLLFRRTERLDRTIPAERLRMVQSRAARA